VSGSSGAGRAIVVGAGVGGLAVARVLIDAGMDVRVVERARRVEPVGAGVALWPNAVHVLRSLGLGEVVDDAAVPKGEQGLRRADGRPLSSMDAHAIEERYGAPLALIHRSTLHRAMLDVVMSERIVTGREVVAATEAGEGIASVRMDDGEELSAELVVGADGLWSSVRQAVLGVAEPRPSGIAAYRGVAAWERPFRSGEYWGSRDVAGLVPIDGGRAYWFRTRREPPNAAPISDEQLVRELAGWAPELGEVVAATPRGAILHHHLFDRPPAKTLIRGRIVLLGDAAHPMLPFIGQGACQALEDASVLGAELAEAGDIPSALQRYDRRRRARTAPLIRTARMLARATHPQTSSTARLRDAVVARLPDRMRHRQLDSILAAPER